MTDLTKQIASEVEQTLLEPLVMLLGPGEELDIVRERIHSHARMWAAQLAGGDDKLAAQTVIDLVTALFPGDSPIPAEWWQTPLGRIVARSVGYPGSEEVSYSIAAAMLGVSKGRVQQLLADRKLDRHPDGGVTTVSVQARLRASS